MTKQKKYKNYNTNPLFHFKKKNWFGKVVRGWKRKKKTRRLHHDLPMTITIFSLNLLRLAFWQWNVNGPFSIYYHHWPERNWENTIFKTFLGDEDLWLINYTVTCFVTVVLYLTFFIYCILDKRKCQEK